MNHKWKNNKCVNCGLIRTKMYIGITKQLVYMYYTLLDIEPSLIKPICKVKTRKTIKNS